MPYVVKSGKPIEDLETLAQKAKDLALKEDLPLKWYKGKDGQKGTLVDNPLGCCVEFRFMAIEDFDLFLRANNKEARMAVIEEIRQLAKTGGEILKYYKTKDPITMEEILWREVRNPAIADTFIPESDLL